MKKENADDDNNDDDDAHGAMSLGHKFYFIFVFFSS
jgi:hypothetical protein